MASEERDKFLVRIGKHAAGAAPPIAEQCEARGAGRALLAQAWGHAQQVLPVARLVLQSAALHARQTDIAHNVPAHQAHLSRRIRPRHGTAVEGSMWGGQVFMCYFPM